MFRKTLFAATICASSMSANAASYGGLDYVSMDVGSSTNQLISATFGQTMGGGLSAELKLGMGLSGSHFDKYNDYESITDSVELSNSISSNGNISSEIEVGSLLGVYGRYSKMMTNQLGFSGYAGVSTYSVNLSSDFINSYQKEVMGPELGASAFYSMKNGPTLTIEISKYKNFYDASVTSFNFGVKTSL